MSSDFRYGVCVSNQLFMRDPDQHKPITFADVLYLATRGSAKVTCLDDVIGTLEPGKKFDAIRVCMDLNSQNAKSVLFGHENLVDLVHKFVFLADDRNLVQVWINGRLVKDLLTSQT